MTREEVIRRLRYIRMDYLGYPPFLEPIDMAIEALSAEAETDGDMGEVSDGYHTFNQLYHQRAVLFATIVKQNKEKAWKSWKHGDGKFCFDSNKEWFIVGVDTPEGSYAYHYEKKYWDMFDCVELEHGKFWDGHTEEDVTRLLSLPSAEAVQILKDGTLEVKVANAQKVGRVLVMDTDSHIGGGLFYPADAVQGEWQKVEEQPYFRKHYDTVCCSVCRKKGNRKWNFCPNCGARMKGGDYE